MMFLQKTCSSYSGHYYEKGERGTLPSAYFLLSLVSIRASVPAERQWKRDMKENGSVSGYEYDPVLWRVELYRHGKQDLR
jgi:hypothetical protein